MSKSIRRMVMKTWLPIAILVLGNVANAQDTDLRTWWSHDGGESLVASLESYDKKTKIVTLKDENDERVTVKITLLSRADRKFVSAAARKTPSVFEKANERSRDSKAASGSEKESKKKPRAFQRYGISWTPDIDKALAQASEENNRKPVMWFRVLGDLNGFM